MFELLTKECLENLVFLYTLGGIGWDWWDDLDSGPQWGWKDQLQWVQVTQKNVKMRTEISFTWQDFLILRALFFYIAFFYTGTINSGPLIYSPNHAEMMLWIPGGLRQVIIRNFQFEPRQFEEMFKSYQILQNIHNIYQGWWWAPSRWSSRRTRWWRWRLLRRPTNASFKKTAQTRATQ